MESLTMQLQPFFEWLLRTTLQASLLICLIILVQAVLRGRLGIRWHYCLWLLLLVRMAMPWVPESRLSVFNLMPKSMPQKQTEYIRQEVRDQSVKSEVADTGKVESTPVSTTTAAQDSREVVTVTPQIRNETKGQFKSAFFELEDILPLVWLAGGLVLGTYVCASNFNLLRIVKRRRPLTDQKILNLLEDCKSQMGIRTILGVVITDKVKSPALFGFVRPRLLLPEGMIEAIGLEELRYVLLHELAHLKRHDIYVGWLMSLLQILHWFNPLIWLAFYRMRADRELACDALVLARTQSGHAKSYGRTIVSLLERFSRSQPLPAMAGILETKSQLKRRITMIARFKKNSYRWSPLAVILIIILGCVSLPDAKRTKASEISTEQTARHITLRQVWSGPGVDVFGAPSPDGRYLSYTDWDTGDLAILEIATGKKRRLTNKGSWDESIEYTACSRWSPDGKQIVYDWYNKDDFIELRIVGLDGLKPRILYRNEEVDWAQTYDWSPDGKQILTCFSRKDGPEQIVLVSVADGSERILKTFDSKWPDKMCFSPDGHYIVYDFSPKEDYLNRDIFLLSIDGNREIPLVEHPADDRVLGWSPDGKNILFASDRTGTPGIWIIQITEGNPKGVPKLVKSSKGPFPPRGLGFTMDGSFYYGHRPNKTDIYFTEIDPETGKIIVTPHEAINRFVESNATPDYSPDGKYLAYISRRPPMTNRYTTNPIGNVLCIRSLETGEEREFRPEINRFGWPRWSPDGRSVLVVDWNANNLMGYYQIDTQTGNVTPVLPRTKHRNLFGRHEWSRDGKTIFYGRRDRKANIFQVIVRDLKSGTEKVLYRSDDEFNISLSPDGQWLALIFFSKDKPRLIVMPAAGGEPRELCRFEKGDGFTFGHNCEITWTDDGKYILYTVRNYKSDDQKRELCRIPTEGGEPQKLGLKMSEFVNLCIHPDGRHIAFSSREKSFSEVWVMENFLPGAPVAKPEPTPTLRQIEVRGRGSVHSRPSFDGKYMLDVDRETGNLIIRELVTSKEWKLPVISDPNAFVYESRMSPDSKRVAFLQFDPVEEDFDLCIIDFDGSGLRTLMGSRQIAGYFNMDAWSPDGEYIFGRLEREPMELVRVSADDGSVQVIKKFEQSTASIVQVSPDGRYLAYSRAEQKSSKLDIFVFDLEQNQETPLVMHPASDRLLGWTPDGQHIFFTSDRNGTWDGWLLRVVDGKRRGLPEVIKAGIGDIKPIGFTKDGLFYYGFRHQAWNVYTAALDRNTGQVVSELVPVRHVGKDAWPDWSPDGRYLAYLTEPDRTKAQVIRIRTLATGQERELKIDLPRFEWLRWCPDSRHLLITNFGWNSPSVVYTVDVQTGEYTPVVRSEQRSIRQAELSADGKTLVYRIRGSGNATWLIARNMETDHEKELLHIGDVMGATSLALWSLSPDGKEVAFSIREGEVESPNVLRILSVETGESRTMVEDIGLFVVWSSDGRDLLFTKEGNELWRVAAVGGEPRRTWEWKEMIWSPRIHPDGQRIAFHSGGYVSEMWVMENFLPQAIAAAGK